ncbi:NAD(P)(+) transhydrogenase (Re/Si-specific) subunit beta [Mesorhizobium sp. B2-3-14]|uniref:NAD(P) transhydrogenase subunit beta n=1 Tax=Mesorhizobium australicum (strain HAMBI 3006 / LMG 24608 / WSM2073) TaxID=754035 RepID=L0KFI3_MESAW|nr:MULTISPECIES: NAD(P)(+) transhydrogenase (Re/Si-specific) subunit beta [Mesorhizobium]MBZ9929320.1 NAD(P)(+) transhydrogenase (Re/Si-specific) subunit beta [Mesorhizobium sp. BR1-1-5]AGB42798.1 NAD/NADP transhydrogenase beta subunit [Mesorhizobium australicum WSM2073]MBZ9680690.1 NAD(P)(+) transhydrogenase (Re/Si-specific) subunit beta [Mesorhizobium sp. CO1-1-2]MBZ9907458.1 NAD(P)(+) transhydrogenase (Re/Si-specific) subunit beta [Mesorhizobium sp. BR115XR7A]MBZ9924168.1 NAD(P)(+) transhyd
MTVNLASFLYLVSGVLFIMALRGLSHPTTSRQGNLYGMIGMGIAIATTLALATPSAGRFGLIVLGLAIGGGVGAVTARRIAMTSMPQLVAAFHSLVGLAAVMVAAAAIYAPESFGIGTDGDIHAQALVEMSLGVAIGAITFTGSVIAFLKLDGRMSGKPIMIGGRHVINAALGVALIVLIVLLVTTESKLVFWLIVAASLVLGVLLIIPIGGADMPVVVSMLNSYSGWAAAALGFTLGNLALIITGALVGSSGAILSYIMCKGMNRSFISVILGGFGGETAAAADDGIERTVKQGSADDAAYLMMNAQKVIIVPGYGMAVAQAQHALREMADKLKANGVDVKYAIHPVAGRMPGHMNVLLAEANVPYDEVFELEDINSEFAQADVAYVIGANDVTNPSARDDKSSPIYGMPILDVDKARTCLFVKRSLGSGYAGIDNTLFYKDGTMMLLGDAKKMTEEIVKAMDH